MELRFWSASMVPVIVLVAVLIGSWLFMRADGVFADSGGSASVKPGCDTFCQVPHAPRPSGAVYAVSHSEEEWKRLLTAEQYRVLRAKGTEPAFTGALWNNHDNGIYRCAGCGSDLFSSATKFDSGTGWPSYWQPVAEDRIQRETDRAYGMTRTEVLCARCGGHLGHVFDDGPRPTGLRYCINSVSLTFEKAGGSP